MSERHGIRGDGLGVSQRERTGVTASEDRVPGVRLNRTRATWDVEVDIDALPSTQPLYASALQRFDDDR